MAASTDRPVPAKPSAASQSYAAGGNEATASIAVVVPTRDTREMTLRCLDRIRSAAVSRTSLIVVDDASRDGTREAIAAEFPEALVLRHEEAHGFTRCANLGMRRAADTGAPFLALINSDTLVPDDLFERALEAVQRDDSIGVWAPRLVYPDGSAQWSFGTRLPGLSWMAVNASGLLHRRRLREPESRPQAPHAAAWCPATCWITPRRTWLELDGFEQAFVLYAQDLDYCSRASRAGWSLVVDPGVVVVHAHGATIAQLSEHDAPRRRVDLLWNDLLVWARRHHGPAWAFAARCCISVGGLVGALVELLVDLSARRAGARLRAVRSLWWSHGTG